jgi:hypothetical protein
LAAEIRNKGVWVDQARLAWESGSREQIGVCLVGRREALCACTLVRAHPIACNPAKLLEAQHGRYRRHERALDALEVIEQLCFDPA